MKHILLSLLFLASAFGQSVPRARSASNAVIVRSGGSYLGVAVVEIDGERAKALKLREERGVEVKVVDEGSPAAKAGIRPDDVVLEFNGQRIEGTAQFVRMVSETPVGRQVSLAISRAGAPQTVSATLESRPGTNRFSMNGSQFVMPPMPPMPPIVMPDLPRNTMSWRSSVLGVETEGLNSQLAEYFGVKEGVLVRMVVRRSAAERAGLKAGDVILRVAGKSVQAPRDISPLIQGKKSVTLSIIRNHKDLNIEVALENEEL
ncbi:MAG: PDZ domain-containing protein [Acidobacteriota bacterium]|nr:PDZ domain-containing protein [Acidobacteriota bacterium]